MSLLLDALRHAERSKGTPEAEARRPSPASAAPAPPDLQLAILEDGAGATGVASAPEAAGAPPSRPQAPADPGAAASRTTVAGGRRLSLSALLLIGVLGGAALATIWYVWTSAAPAVGDTAAVVAAAPAPLPVAPEPQDAAPAAGPVAVMPEAAAPARAPVAEGASKPPRTGPVGQTAAQARASAGEARQSGSETASTRPAPPAAALDIQTTRHADPLGPAWQALRDGDFERAERLYRAALAEEPRQPDALLGLATVIEWRGDAAGAAAAYRDVLARDPANAHALAALARLGRAAAPETESQLRSLIAERPAAPLLFALGNLLAADQRWADAQAAYFEAASLAPAQADYVYNLAVALDRLGQPRAAARHYARALELASGGGTAAFDLAATRARLAALEPAGP